MNILFLLSHYPGFGGIEKVTGYIASYLRSQNYIVTILSYGTNNYPLVKDVPSDIELAFCPKPLDYNSKENTDFISDYLKNHDIDYIILQDSYAPIEHLLIDIDYPWISKLIIVEHNTPLFLLKTVNSYFYYDNGIKFFIERILRYPGAIVKAYLQSKIRHRFLLDHCRRYVLLSDSYRSDIHTLVGNRYDCKIGVITNPLTIFEPTVQDYSEKKHRQVLFIGRMSNQKGFHFLLKIWEEFSKLDTNEWQLVLIVAGAVKKDIEQTIKRKNLKNIRIDEPTTNIHNYYEESSILAVTSIYEGFPLILAEAMSRGCVPVVFDSFKSVHDIVDNRKNGVLVSPFNTKIYAKRIYELTLDKEKLLKLSKNGMETVKKFSMKSVGQQWLNLINDLSRE